MRRPAHRRHGAAGFTLIELLVAIAVMALIAVMSWRGIDGMARSQARTEAYSNEVLAIQMGLAQWTADLEAMEQGPRLNGMDWDGRVLRLTRRDAYAADPALRVVAWTRRLVGARAMWLRWQSVPLRTQQDLQAAWQQAALWAQTPDEQLRRNEVVIAPLDNWQLFYYRQNAWSHPLSSDATASPGAASAAPPDGVRLVLTLPEGSPLAGVITSDWVRPTLGGNKS